MVRMFEVKNTQVLQNKACHVLVEWHVLVIKSVARGFTQHISWYACSSQHLKIELQMAQSVVENFNP